MRYAARTDSNHQRIVKALRDCGCSVQSLAALGEGVPDLLVARNGMMWLLEVKDGDKCPSQRGLTPRQEEWIACWKSRVHVVNSVDEALAAVDLDSSENNDE